VTPPDKENSPETPTPAQGDSTTEYTEPSPYGEAGEKKTPTGRQPSSSTKGEVGKIKLERRHGQKAQGWPLKCKRGSGRSRRTNLAKHEDKFEGDCPESGSQMLWLHFADCPKK
jgi:hypothetical protein